MKFQEKGTLRVQDDFNGAVYNDIDGLLVGDNSIATLIQNNYDGSCETEMFPAWHEGKRVWLMSHQYHPTPGSGGCDSNTEEVIDFETGANILIKEGAFRHLWKNEEEV